MFTLAGSVRTSSVYTFPNLAHSYQFLFLSSTELPSPKKPYEVNFKLAPKSYYVFAADLGKISMEEEETEETLLRYKNGNAEWVT